MNIVCLFPGQGSQDPSFARGFADSEFEGSCCAHAQRYHQWSLMHSHASFIQPRIVGDALWIWEQLLPFLGAHNVSISGHSLGELTASSVNLQWEWERTLALAHTREELMHKQSRIFGEVQVAALLGPIDRIALSRICHPLQGPWIMNDNALEQIVIGGSPQHIAEIMEQKATLGVRKQITLPMSVLSHCSAMEGMTASFQSPLMAMKSHRPPLYEQISSVDLESKNSIEKIQTSLVEQLTSCVRFRELIAWHDLQKTNIFIEVGSGQVLRGLVQKNSSTPCFSTQTAHKLNEVIHILTEHAL